MNEFLVEIRVIVGFTLERAKKKSWIGCSYEEVELHIGMRKRERKKDISI